MANIKIVAYNVFLSHFNFQVSVLIVQYSYKQTSDVWSSLAYSVYT